MLLHEVNKTCSAKSLKCSKGSFRFYLNSSGHCCVKYGAVILQNAFRRPPILDEKLPLKLHLAVKFGLVSPFIVLVFGLVSCILHHFAFLVCLPAHYFSRPITRFLPLKTHFLMSILPFSALFLVVLRGYIYTIAADVYSYCLAFSSKSHCVLHQNTLRLAPKHTAISTKTHCI